MQAISVFGVAPEETWPFVAENRHVASIEYQPPHAAYIVARNTYPIEYLRLDPDDDDDVTRFLREEEMTAVGVVTLARLKQCLTEGYPVVFSFRYYWTPAKGQKSSIPWVENENGLWAKADADLPTEKKFDSLPEICPKQRHKGPDQIGAGGHTVLAVGFEDPGVKVDGKTLPGRVLCQNSIGADTASRPHFWVSYDWITDFVGTEDFWMIRLAEEPGSRIPPPPVLGKPTEKQQTIWEATPVADDTEFAMSPMATIATIGRKMWWISANGSVQTAFCEPPRMDGIGLDIWKTLQVAGPDAASSGGITAVSPAPAQIEVYWITPGGPIQGCVTAADGEWTPVQSLAHGQATPRGAIQAVATPPNSNTVDLFWNGPSADANKGATIYTSHRQNPTAEWTDPTALMQSSVDKTIDVTCNFTTVPFPDGCLALWITTDGSIHACLRPLGSTAWQLPPQRILGPHSATWTSRIAGCFSGDNKIVMFFVSSRGQLTRYSWPLGTNKPGESHPKATKDSFILARGDTDIKLAGLTPDSEIQLLFVSPQGVLKLWAGGKDVRDIVAVCLGTGLGVLLQDGEKRGRLEVVAVPYEGEGVVVVTEVGVISLWLPFDWNGILRTLYGPCYIC